MSEHDKLLEWFWKLRQKDFFETENIISDTDILDKREFYFLKSMSNKYHYQGKDPSEAQIRKLKGIWRRIHRTEEDLVYRKPNRKELADHEIKHMTVRMAWHDNSWNGRICKSPENNLYCVGEYSLLSERLRRNRNIDIENHCAEEPLNSIDLGSYIPPCFWSINLLGKAAYEIEHVNPAMPGLESIKEELPSNSVFTWPFKLSFTRDEHSPDGKYPANLVERLKNYRSKFEENRSIVFLYTNFSNPVSGEEQQYLVLGCSFLKSMGERKDYKIPSDKLKERRQKRGYQNFPTINWAIRLSVDMESGGFILPYHDYLDDAEKSNNFERLDRIKVTVSEPELIHCFKYVSMDIDDDQAIFILSKLRRSLFLIKDDGIAPNYDVENAIKTVEYMLKISWEKRSHFPGFTALAKVVMGKPNNEPISLFNFIQFLKENYSDQYSQKLEALLENPDEVESSLSPEYKYSLADLSDSLKSLRLPVEKFLRLSMLNLTYYQFERLLDPTNELNLHDVASNPYLLFEEYECSSKTEDEVLGDTMDAPIELYRIDIAYFPNYEYLPKIRKLQNYLESDKRRLRALVIDHLRGLEGQGHCFDEARKIELKLAQYPLFYKSKYQLPPNVLTVLEDDFASHITEKLTVQTEGATKYYYLKSLWGTELRIRKKISKLLNSKDYKVGTCVDYNESAKYLSNKLGDKFNLNGFLEERNHFYKNILRKRIYVLCGGPGTGKSFELLKIITELKRNREDYYVLTPTGKAALRLKKNEEGISEVNAQTIAKLLWNLDHGYERKKSPVNLIIDEMSMIDLITFGEILEHFDDHEIKRLILVGDKHQLPPIGYGKIFVDIIQFLLDKGYKDNISIFDTNCRQELDDSIIHFSKIFSGENKSYEDLGKRIVRGGGSIEGTDGIFLKYWERKDELYALINNRITELYSEQFGVEDTIKLLNRVFNLSESGYVDGRNNPSDPVLDSFQIITPYRTSFHGTTGINLHIHEKRSDEFMWRQSLKYNEKVIQTKNIYKNNGLLLSNGSIGLTTKIGKWDHYIFSEAGEPIEARSIDNENIEFAYAITVHKSQGSGFDHIFLVLPKRKGLLSKELLYTGLTRSRQGISLFVQGTPEQEFEHSIFEKIRCRTYVDLRRTTLMEHSYWDNSLMPEEGVNVDSRIEFIIYRALMKAKDLEQFTFEFAQELPVKGCAIEKIKPDFTIRVRDHEPIYWEHLGLIKKYNYQQTWAKKLEIYKSQGLIDRLVTTDELNGINGEQIDEIIFEILSSPEILGGEDTSTYYSKHHYSLNFK